MNPDKYIDIRGYPYEPSFRKSVIKIEVLELLKGRKWDKIALSYVTALRPSYIRVNQGMVTAEPMAWRVTVTIDENNIIQKICQEAIVDLPKGIDHGMHLEQLAKENSGTNLIFKN